MDVANFIIKDDSPLKYHKNVAIAKSGIYQYHISELRGLFDGELVIPPQHASRTIFNVYRPKEVLKDAKGLFVRLPLTREHPEDFVTAENIRDKKTEWIGWTGDSSSIAFLETDNELTINSTLNILDKVGIKAYDNGIKEVSPGYVADFAWKDGEDHNKTEYQIVMTKINEVNHLALVDAGRGGKDASILDSKKEPEMDKETKNLFDKFMSMFKNEKKILDSMPKDLDKFTDEQKDYLLKETHRLLQHRVSGKSFDSFMPIGYSKDDMPDMAEDTSEEVEKVADGEAEAHEKIAEGLKEDIKADETEEKSEDAFPEELEKKDGDVEDAPAEKSSIGAETSVDPIKVNSTSSEQSTQPQEPARAKDHDITVKLNDSKIEDKNFDPFSVTTQIRTGFGSVKKENK